MTKIHTGTPGVITPLADVDEVRPQTPVQKAEPPLVAPDLPPGSQAPSVAREADPRSAPVTLGEIGALRLRDDFGIGARVRPLAMGVQSLDDPSRPENAELLGLDLHALMLEGAEGDPDKLAAVQALADAYGTEALGPITLDADTKKDPS